jgi:hypothetical protein
MIRVIETLVGIPLVGLLIHKETILWMYRGDSFEKALLMVRVFLVAATLSVPCARIEEMVRPERMWRA